MLNGIGVSPAAERVYRALLRHPTSGMAELAEHADVPADGLAELLEQLADAGLVREAGEPLDDALTPAPGAAGVSGAPGVAARWRPLDPRVAVSALVHQRQERLDQALRAADELAADFVEGMLRAQHSQLAEVIDGERHVVAALLNITAEARTEVAVLDAPPYLDATASETAERSLIARGVRSRAVYATAALETDRYPTIQQMIASGEEARVLPTVPLKLVVVDRSRALLPLSVRDGKIFSAILVHRSMLTSALSALFDALWSQAAPLPLDVESPPAAELDDADRKLITLLASGLKDEAIARQLGISTRTLRRRITHLMAQLGANSRFQAGMQALRRDWITTT